jgi:hypothetical protein
MHARPTREDPPMRQVIYCWQTIMHRDKKWGPVGHVLLDHSVALRYLLVLVRIEGIRIESWARIGCSCLCIYLVAKYHLSDPSAPSSWSLVLGVLLRLVALPYNPQSPHDIAYVSNNSWCCNLWVDCQHTKPDLSNKYLSLSGTIWNQVDC